MTLTDLARAYYSEGVRGNPIGLSQAKSLFLRDLRFGNGKFFSCATYASATASSNR